VGNRRTGTSEALTVVRAKDGIPEWSALDKLIDEWRPELLLVGSPLNMNGSESELSRLAQKFGRRIRERFQLPVDYVDERLSSFEAKQLLKAQGHRGDYRKQPADSLAAKLILETWLAGQPDSDASA
jgi:putative Holliday junction resolvase